MRNDGTQPVDSSRSRLGKDGEFSSRDTLGRKCAGIQMHLGDPHQVACIVDSNINVGRAGIILNSAIYIVTQNAHELRSFRQIRKTLDKFIVVIHECVFKLGVTHEGWIHCHHNRCCIPVCTVGSIGCKGLVILTEDAAHQVASGTVMHNDVELFRVGRLILAHILMINRTNSAFCCSLPASANGMNAFNDCGRECRLRSGSVLGCDTHLFTR